MTSCWQADPTKRPGFDALVTCFELLLAGCCEGGYEQVRAAQGATAGGAKGAVRPAPIGSPSRGGLPGAGAGARGGCEVCGPPAGGAGPGALARRAPALQPSPPQLPPPLQQEGGTPQSAQQPPQQSQKAPTSPLAPKTSGGLASSRFIGGWD
ncbi:hypothetical protein MNEG_14789 [Monoraphidium neglectum]|uniref:Uncharacterized protein n=1 Tax=Monoraphidium neglectum TaxID=145388 RepID=A0A0D2LN23_9CHLO|nr:hypothetical protein MNEG_14789 [Monoraphidium neglectum]KIY93174.1 hypothetical protein MNEG_14789 [Monoraphidium neglectum]|eukprot:XP_013892194.1 hypothetical protein MNEG_14789 [Monoraphidium neglectum]